MPRALTSASGQWVARLARQPRVAIGSLGLGGVLLAELIAALVAQSPG